jgi:hypothetical protein
VIDHGCEWSARLAYDAGRADALLRYAPFARNIKGDEAAVDLNPLPVEAPIPNHLDRLLAIVEFKTTGGVLLRA